MSIKSFNSFNEKKSVSLNEHQETDNYMFFGNLETMKRLVDELLEMDHSQIDSILNEHDWASDHISVATENLEQVFDFLAGHNLPEGGMEHEMEHEMEEHEEEHEEKHEEEEHEEEEENGGLMKFGEFGS
jgi:DNA-binding LacI/PurR family transcriptional regulator